MWWITPNEKREVQNFDVSTDPNMDKIVLPSGMQFIDDMQPVADLTNTANDYGSNNPANMWDGNTIAWLPR